MNGIECLEKGEQYISKKIIQLEPNGNIYEIKYIVYYEDDLTNWYRQEVIVDYMASSVVSGGKHLGIITFKVKKEEQIKEEDIPDYKNNSNES